MDFAASPFEIKQLNESGLIEGLLAGFGDVDLGGDKLLPGSLSKSLASRSQPLPMLLHHDLSRPVGAWKSWEERSEGLYVKGALTLSTRDAQEAHALAKDGALTGLSIGWRPLAYTNDAAGVRVVSEAKLFEGSLVAVPMHERTRISAVKSITNAKDIAELLQEAGWSSRKAKAAAGAAWKTLNQNNDAEAEAEVITILNSAAERIAAMGAC